MTDTRPPRPRTSGRIAAAVTAGVVLTACGLGPDRDVTPPGPRPPTRPVTTPPDRGPEPRPGTLVVTQQGLPGLELNRQVLDISTSDLEDALGGGEFFLAAQTEDCGLATNRDLGIAAVTNDDLAVVAFVVERPDAATPEGIQLGSSVDDIVGAYGQSAVFASDARSPTGGRVVWVTDLASPGQEPTAASLHYAFDTDPAGRVTRLRAGFWPHVAHADYCSDEASRPEATGWPLS